MLAVFRAGIRRLDNAGLTELRDRFVKFHENLPAVAEIERELERRKATPLAAPPASRGIQRVGRGYRL